MKPNGSAFLGAIDGNGPQSKLGAGGLCPETDGEGLDVGVFFS